MKKVILMALGLVAPGIADSATKIDSKGNWLISIDDKQVYFVGHAQKLFCDNSVMLPLLRVRCDAGGVQFSWGGLCEAPNEIVLIDTTADEHFSAVTHNIEGTIFDELTLDDFLKANFAIVKQSPMDGLPQTVVFDLEELPIIAYENRQLCGL